MCPLTFSYSALGIQCSSSASDEDTVRERSCQEEAIRSWLNRRRGIRIDRKGLFHADRESEAVQRGQGLRFHLTQSDEDVFVHFKEVIAEGYTTSTKV